MLQRGIGANARRETVKKSHILGTLGWVGIIPSTAVNSRTSPKNGYDISPWISLCSINMFNTPDLLEIILKLIDDTEQEKNSLAPISLNARNSRTYPAIHPPQSPGPRPILAQCRH